MANMVVMTVLMGIMAAAMAWLALRKQEKGVPPEEVENRLRAERERFDQLLEAQHRTQAAMLETLRESFGNLASEKLAEKTSALSAENAKNVKPLFDQLKEAFGQLKTATEGAEKANVQLGSMLVGKIEDVGRKAQSLGQQADEFVTALKGGNKIQGNWGEGILAQVLEDAGLKRDVNFKEQTGAQGAGLPDVTVYDGAHRRILIDSKVNIADFLTAVNAGRDGDAKLYAKGMMDHAASVRKQIKSLAEKRYPVRMKDADEDPNADYSDVVIMMMPSEATYAAAVTADPKLLAFANEQNIVLASPQMLFGYLVLFKAGLDRQQLNRRYQDIAKNAGYIVERMDAAFKALETVKTRLDDARNAYADALGKLGNGTNSQNVLGPAREILRLTEMRKELKSAAFKE